MEREDSNSDLKLGSQEATSAVNRNMWACRPATVENREHQMGEAVMENRVQAEDVLIEENSVQSCPHSALSQTVDGTLNKTLNIPDVPCPAAVDSSASCQSKRGVNDVLAAMQQYQALLVTDQRSQLQTVFQQHQGSELEKEAMAVFDWIEDPFVSVATTYRQDNVIKENVNFVESKEVLEMIDTEMGAIRLLAIAKKSELSECRVDGILGRLYEDLVMLYGGVNVQTGNGECEIFASLVSICGDTLAQHELCGFKESVAIGFAYSKCQQCECSFEDMQMYFDEDNVELRTLERHVWQCGDIEKANTEHLRNRLKTTFGVNRRSKLPTEEPAIYLQKRTLFSPVLVFDGSRCLLAIGNTPVTTFAKEELGEGSQAQTRRLIRFRDDNEPRFLKSKASAKQQWQALISELELEGKVSSQQVSKKWENLKKRYKELKTGKSGAGTDAGEVTATNWQYYEDMHEVLGARPCMDPPLLVDAGAEEEDIPTTMDTVEPTPSPSPSSSSSPPPPKRRKSDPIMDFLEKESMKEEERHRETQHNTDRFLSLFERLLEKI
ncbi:hypothetical protein PAMA_018830 [Pampus argenteus]